VITLVFVGSLLAAPGPFQSLRDVRYERFFVVRFSFGPFPEIRLVAGLFVPRGARWHVGQK
jgi:hypothetical protein